MGSRRCVKCEQDFLRKLVGDVEVDLCPGCGGLWLDHSELQRLAELPNEHLVGLQAFVQKTDNDANPYRQADWAQHSEAERLDVACPACPGKLTRAQVGSIQVEVCSGCAGVFLDAGELEQAIGEVRDRKEKLATIAAMARSVTTRGTIG